MDGMEIKLKILPPAMPNFIFCEDPKSPELTKGIYRGDGIPVGDLTKEQAEEYGELMKQTFIKHWLKKHLVK
jgi:hypothetical protein